MSSTININKAAEQCVMCGLCLPHCPTYQISQHEAESPRGRISLIKAYAEKNLQPSSALETHLQSCTTCLKCENVCPANVSYEMLIDHGRKLYRPNLNLTVRLKQFITINALSTRWGHKFIALAAKFVSLLPERLHITQILKVSRNFHPLNIQNTHSKTITVLPGCTGNLFDKQTVNSIANIMSSLGYNMNMPDKILCCGALAQHSGLPDIANKQIQSTKDFLKDKEKCISFASGCGRQYDKHYANESTSHEDILKWLTSNKKLTNLMLNPLDANVLIHSPCTVDQHDIDICEQVLTLIPKVQILKFTDGLFCCGAGGAQLLSPTDSNLQLLDAKIATVKSLQPDIIVSSNIGCAMHLQIGLRKSNLDIEVIHPVTLLSRQLTH